MRKVEQGFLTIGEINDLLPQTSMTQIKLMES